MKKDIKINIQGSDAYVDGGLELLWHFLGLYLIQNLSIPSAPTILQIGSILYVYHVAHSA